mgnify:FL=1
MKEQILKRLKLLPNLKATIDGVDADLLDSLADDAIVQAQTDGFSDSSLVLGATYLLAHWCTAVCSESSNVAEQTASVLTVKYFDRCGSDDYLAEYKRLKASLTGNYIAFL